MLKVEIIFAFFENHANTQIHSASRMQKFRILKYSYIKKTLRFRGLREINFKNKEIVFSGI